MGVYLGWFGSLSRPLQGASAVGSLLTRIPGVKAGGDALAARLVKGSTGGPDAEARSKGGSHVVAIAYDASGRQLSEVQVTGVDGRRVAQVRVMRARPPRKAA